MKGNGQKSFKRIDLFNMAVMFPIDDRGLGFAPKGAGIHIHVGVERDNSGIFIVKTIEPKQGRPKGHSITVHISNDELQKGFVELAASIRGNEIDPTYPRFTEWIVLIPKPATLDPDSPLGQELLGYRRGTLNLALDRVRLDDLLYEMFYIVKMSDITRRPQRQFKWALAYPSEDWRTWEGNMRWLRNWDGYFYLISDREQSRLMNRIFKPALDRLKADDGQLPSLAKGSQPEESLL